jgi:putative copper export protein
MTHLANVKMISKITPAIKYNYEINLITIVSLFVVLVLAAIRSRIKTL